MAQLQSVDEGDSLDLGPSFEQLHQLVSGNSTIETFDKYTRDTRGPRSLFMLNKQQGRFWEVTILDLTTYDHQGPIASYSPWSATPVTDSGAAGRQNRFGANGVAHQGGDNTHSATGMDTGGFEDVNVNDSNRSSNATDPLDTHVVDHRTKAQLLRWLRRQLRDRLLGGFVMASPPTRKRKVSVDGNLDLPGIARLSPQAVLQEVTKRNLRVVPVLTDRGPSAVGGSVSETPSAAGAPGTSDTPPVLPSDARPSSARAMSTSCGATASVQGGGVTDDEHLDRVIALCLHVSGLDGSSRGQTGNFIGSLGSLVSPLDFLAYGGTRLGKGLFPFGPARLLDAQDVQRFHLAVAGISDEQLRTAELQNRLNQLGLTMPSPPSQALTLASPTKAFGGRRARPGAASSFSFHSNNPLHNNNVGSDGSSGSLPIEQQVAAAASVDYLIGKFNQLRAFLTRAVERRNGVLLYHI